MGVHLSGSCTLRRTPQCDPTIFLRAKGVNITTVTEHAYVPMSMDCNVSNRIFKPNFGKEFRDLMGEEISEMRAHSMPKNF
jgi:hypothetical protein